MAKPQVSENVQYYDGKDARPHAAIVVADGPNDALKLSVFTPQGGRYIVDASRRSGESQGWEFVGGRTL